MSDQVAIGIAVSELRPTQMTVGLREVALKRAAWRDADAHGRGRLLRRHVLPAVIGPRERPYITDHHHFARALLDEKAGNVAVFIVADLSHLPKAEFWTILDNSGWCHAYDHKGRRRELDDIPRGLDGLADDPCRSLAGALIRAGACAKSTRPFAEFLWADFLRRRLDDLPARDYDRALKEATALARSHDARCLPGWCGPNDQGT